MRRNALGFDPQKEIIYNKYLPYAQQLDEECVRHLSQIKANIPRSLLLNDWNSNYGFLWIEELSKQAYIYVTQNSQANYCYILVFFKTNILYKIIFKPFFYLNSSYISLYGLCFSKEDHIYFIQLLYNVIIIPEIYFQEIQKYAKILIKLLK